MSRPRNRSIRSAPLLAAVVGAGVTRSRGFNCRACGQWFGVFQNATSLSAGQNAINSARTFALECPACAHADEYLTSEIVEFAPAEPEAPAQNA